MIASSQLPLTLPYRKSFGRSDFFIAPCNEEAVFWVDNFLKWPAHAVLICGETGSGKTHLASLFSSCHFDADTFKNSENLSGSEKKIVLENIDTITDETALFHFFNWTKEQGIFVLMTAHHVPDFQLPDLKTRIGSIPKIFISLPDDALLNAVLLKNFSDRRVSVEENILNYILTHTPRSFQKINELVCLIDALSLSMKRPITIPLVKEALEHLNQSDKNK